MDRAASPVVVLGTFVAIAIAITAAVMLLLDQPEPGLALQGVPGNPLAVEVAAVAGGLRWDDLGVVLLDPSGRDVGGTYLQVPSGPIKEADLIQLRYAPPAGDYLLLAREDGVERARVVLSF